MVYVFFLVMIKGELKMKIVYLGLVVFFIYVVVVKVFLKEEMIVKSMILDCIMVIEKEDVDVVVVLIENMIEGSVNIMLDYLFYFLSVFVVVEIVFLIV